MTDEITSNPEPTNTAILQTPETTISTPPEAVIAPAPVEAPTESIPEPASGHLGGNDPMEPAPAESIPPAPSVEITTETSVAITEPAPAETIQPTPTESVIEAVSEPTAVETSTPVQAPTEAPLVAQVETPAPTQTSEPVVARVPAPAPTPIPTPAQIVATAVAPIVATTITQAFTKSMRELFTKALNARQNKKRKKLDRILSLFAKQTSITNNEVEKLLHISDSTATRYLATLTKEGKIKQNTKKGQATSYSKI